MAKQEIIVDMRDFMTEEERKTYFFKERKMLAGHGIVIKTKTAMDFYNGLGWEIYKDLNYDLDEIQKLMAWNSAQKYITSLKKHQEIGEQNFEVLKVNQSNKEESPIKMLKNNLSKDEYLDLIENLFNKDYYLWTWDGAFFKIVVFDIGQEEQYRNEKAKYAKWGILYKREKEEIAKTIN